MRSAAALRTAARLASSARFPARNPRENLPITDADAAKWAGTYTNGRATIPLTVRDGKLMAPRGEVKRIGENRFVLPGPAQSGDPAAAEFLLVVGADGKAGYLIRGGRALKRQ